MTLLPQTRQVRDKLRKAGFSYRDARVYTRGSYTFVDFKCSPEKQLQLAVPLSRLMKVRLGYSGESRHIDRIQVDAFGSPQLYVTVTTWVIRYREFQVNSVEEGQAIVSEALATPLEEDKQHQVSG